METNDARQPVVIELDRNGWWWGWPIAGGRRVCGRSVGSVRRALELQLRELGIRDESASRLQIEYRLPFDFKVPAVAGAENNGSDRLGDLSDDLLERIVSSRVPIGRADLEDLFGITSADLDNFFRRRCQR